jgi:hypothetical protein
MKLRKEIKLSLTQKPAWGAVAARAGFFASCDKKATEILDDFPYCINPTAFLILQSQQTTATNNHRNHFRNQSLHVPAPSRAPEKTFYYQIQLHLPQYASGR